MTHWVCGCLCVLILYGDAMENEERTGGIYPLVTLDVDRVLVFYHCARRRGRWIQALGDLDLLSPGFKIRSGVLVRYLSWQVYACDASRQKFVKSLSLLFPLYFLSSLSRRRLIFSSLSLIRQETLELLVSVI